MNAGPPPGDDHRTSPRAGCELPVELQFASGLAGTFTANLSTGGMFVRHVSPQPVGTLVRFRLDLGAGESIEGMGEVKWIRVRHQGPELPAGSGIRFRHLASSDRERLRLRIVEELASRPPEPPRPAHEELPPWPASLAPPPAAEPAAEEDAAADRKPRRGAPEGGPASALPAARPPAQPTARSTARPGARSTRPAPPPPASASRLPGPLARLKPRERLLGGLLLAALLAWLLFG